MVNSSKYNAVKQETIKIFNIYVCLSTMYLARVVLSVFLSV